MPRIVGIVPCWSEKITALLEFILQHFEHGLPPPRSIPVFAIKQPTLPQNPCLWAVISCGYIYT